MTVWSLGACFACPKCLLRSAWRICPSCGGDAVDLRSASLEPHWSAWGAFTAGRALWHPRALKWLRVIRRVAMAFTVVVCLGPLFGPWVKEGRPPTAPEVGLSLGLGLLAAWPVYEFFSLYLFLIAHVLRGLSLLTGLAAAISPLRKLKFSVLAMLTRALSRPLLPQLEVRSEPRLDGSALRGTLTAPLLLDFVRDGWGFMERFDVHASTPARVKFEHGEEELPLVHGGVSVDQAMGRRGEGAHLPAWLHAPGRDGVHFSREFPVGTRVRLTRARHGHDDARVLLELG